MHPPAAATVGLPPTALSSRVPDSRWPAWPSGQPSPFSTAPPGGAHHHPSLRHRGTPGQPGRRPRLNGAKSAGDQRRASRPAPSMYHAPPPPGPTSTAPPQAGGAPPAPSSDHAPAAPALTAPPQAGGAPPAPSSDHAPAAPAFVEEHPRQRQKSRAQSAAENGGPLSVMKFSASYPTTCARTFAGSYPEKP